MDLSSKYKICQTLFGKILPSFGLILKQIVPCFTCAKRFPHSDIKCFGT